MKKLIGMIVLLLVTVLLSCVYNGCSLSNEIAAANFAKEAKSAKYTSEYAMSINKLEMSEGNFESPRRVIFYNVRLGETVFVCEGYSHIAIDRDGDCEIVIKTGKNSYKRHYLGVKQDITYFSEQIDPTEDIENYKYKVVWNPKLWIPDFDNSW